MIRMRILKVGAGCSSGLCMYLRLLRGPLCSRPGTLYVACNLCGTRRAPPDCPSPTLPGHVLTTRR